MQNALVARFCNHSRPGLARLLVRLVSDAGLREIGADWRRCSLAQAAGCAGLIEPANTDAIDRPHKASRTERARPPGGNRVGTSDSLYCCVANIRFVPGGRTAAARQ
jgi:hypothetical protein